MSLQRVLLINDHATQEGGAERQVRNEQEYLGSKGYQVRSIGFSQEEGSSFTDDVIVESRSRVVRVIGGLSISPSIFLKIRKRVNAFNPDVIHVHQSQKYPATVALATAGYPSIKTHHDYSTVCPSSWGVKKDDLEVCECGIGKKCWQHGCLSLPVVVGYYGPKHILQKRIERKIITEHVAPSRTLTQFLREFGYDARQIPNPESVHELPIGGDDGYFLFVGRLSEEKGVAFLTDAFEKLSEYNSEFEVKVAGAGELDEQVRKSTESTESGKFELLGYVSESEKKELYRNARAVVVPSIWMENYPTVVLEAFSHGKPVIGSDRGGISGMVEHGETGLLHPPTDPAELAANIQKLRTNPAMAREMGRAGREWLHDNSSYQEFGEGIERTLSSISSRGDRRNFPARMLDRVRSAFGF